MTGSLWQGKAYMGVSPVILGKDSQEGSPQLSFFSPPALKGELFRFPQMNHIGLVVEKLELILGTTDMSQHSRRGCPHTRLCPSSQGPILDGRLVQGHQPVARHPSLEDPETCAVMGVGAGPP